MTRLPAEWLVMGRDGDTPIATTGHGAAVHRLDLSTMEPAGPPFTLDSPIWSSAVVIAHLAGREVVVSAGTTIEQHDLLTGHSIGEPFATPSPTHLLTVARWQGRTVALTKHLDGHARLWDLAAGELLADMTEWAETIALRPHADTVLAIGENHPVDTDTGIADHDELALDVWDFYTGSRWCPPLVGGGVGGALSYPPIRLVADTDRMLLLSGAGGDGTVRIWDLGTGAEHAPPAVPFAGDGATALATGSSGDGRVLVVAGSDHGALRCWAVGDAPGRETAGHNGKVTGLAVAVLGDTQLVVSAGADGAVRVWTVDGTVLRAGDAS